ncbi:hypothetical protein GobsT_32280 [Gemmata obscuriglobus]|uniref:Uncharacterized protein n=1 Tax=Gemmata obscuriglobus TaxID=114 RepID=A0A2Z3HA89_9BACT|nr:hypothetical protein [Gemmata obscuriglobus]AWM38594.1 hypothetical protein C1280_17465 [Gemmata obscuriglobus]QEG28449.1 hypothetical protein GobsT_32280 [Gemmata obscuriglobus]VTS06436.1 Uncharacterized protein OS=Planctomyces limnophilus (strain ATCC 43296 / DSM 3776 / IFAM 1008 / 290) GN=Plim_3710 PE=4 SV=1 [Gemmata obscuriglobus UQM 2246]
MRKPVRNLLLVVGGCALVLLLVETSRLMWVGSTDLTVEFVITDADTGQPLNGAEIVVTSRGGFYEGDNRLRAKGVREEEFILKTDANGAAEYVCRDSMCHGQSSPLGLNDTFAVYMPHWNITVKALGYSSTALPHLEQFMRSAERTGPRRSKVVVPIALHRDAS